MLESSAASGLVSGELADGKELGTGHLGCLIFFVLIKISWGSAAFKRRDGVGADLATSLNCSESRKRTNQWSSPSDQREFAWTQPQKGGGDRDCKLQVLGVGVAEGSQNPQTHTRHNAW